MNDLQLLVFARCAGFVSRAPGFSHPDVPPPVRAGFAFALALAFSQGLTANPVFGAGGFTFAIASEALIGATVGVAASMLFDGAYAGGRALDDYVGIRASVPSAGIAAGAGFGRLWSLVFAAGFFVLGGYRVALEAFANTFVTLPPGVLIASSDLQTVAVALPLTLVRAAIFTAGPAVALALCAQLGLATVARVVPRFSTFTLAFPIVFACAVLATIAALPVAVGSASRPWMDLGPLRAR